MNVQALHPEQHTFNLITIIMSLSFLNISLLYAADPIPDQCGYFVDATSTRQECTQSSGGTIKFTGKANIYDNPDTALSTCNVETPQWVLNQTQTCETDDCTAEPGNAKSLNIDYNHPFTATSVSNTPSNSTQNEDIHGDVTLEDDQYNSLVFKYDGNSVTFEQSSGWSSNPSTLKVNTITSAWNVLFKDDVAIKIGTISSATYNSPFSLRNEIAVPDIEINTLDYKEGSTIDLNADDSIKIESFTVGRGDSNVVLKAENITINNLTVSNSGSNQAHITLIGDNINIGTLDMGQGATVTILPYTSGETVTLTSDTIKASSSSSLILSSGDYYMKTFDIPGTSDASSVRALNDNQIVNLYIDGDFKPGNNPGINSAGNNANFGTLPPTNFRMFINGDLETGGGGTTFNAIIYTEGDATLGNPTYIKGALSASQEIDIGEGSKIYYSVKNSEPYLSCPIEGSNDLCYDSITTKGFSLFGMGMFYGVTTPIRNISDESISDATIIKSFDGINMSMMSNIKIDGDDKTTDKDADEAEINQNLQASFGFFNAGGIFDKGIVYRVTNFDENQTHTIYDYSMFSFDWSKIKLTTVYTKNGKRYYSTIGACGSSTTPYITGPFDAWDTFRDNISTPPTDRNISTKIVNKAFHLSLASLNKTNDGYETKMGAGSIIRVAIYSNNSNMKISNEELTFDANNSAHITTTAMLTPNSGFTVNRAERNASVGFKFCATYENNTTLGDTVYYLYPNSACSYYPLDECNTTTSGTPTWHICKSSDDFAIRPNKFAITPINSKIKSAQQKNLEVNATDYSNAATSDYNISSTLYSLNTNDIKYMPNGDENSSLNGSSQVHSFSFSNGSSSDLSISFNDVGKVQIQIQDTHWSSVDIDDTPQTCDENGSYICGDVNVTFIPAKYKLDSVDLHNNKDVNFTYLSSDLNMSAQITLTITAENENNDTTKNFTLNAWEDPVDINISLNNPPYALIQKEINGTKIGFENGSATITMSETNISKKLLFNFHRDINTSINPFTIRGSDIAVTASTIYSPSVKIFGSNTADRNTTFLYGRAHAPRQSFVGNEGNATIYYEAYCSGNDCNKSLLPDGTSSKYSDDPRWFINTQHSPMSDGNIASISQKNSASLVTSASPNGSNPDKATLTYTKDKNYPYKTTMEMNASKWLIYNKYNPNAVVNEFEVEFINNSGNWAGEAETDSTTKKNAADQTNRRLMW